jgi:hypothetical protein
MSSELEQLEALAQRLRTVPVVAPSPVARERGWNLVRSQIRYAPQTRSVAPLNWRLGLAAAFAAVLLIIGTLGAAASSLPDSPLYPLKSFEESVQGLIAFQPVDQFNFHLKLARRRLAEAQAMFAAGHTDLGIRMLNALDDQISEAAEVVHSVKSSDPRLGDQMGTALTAAVEAHTQSLTSLQGKLTNPRALNAIANAEDHAQRALQVASGPSTSPTPQDKGHPSPKGSGSGPRGGFSGNQPSLSPSGQASNKP